MAVFLFVFVLWSKQISLGQQYKTRGVLDSSLKKIYYAQDFISKTSLNPEGPSLIQAVELIGIGSLVRVDSASLYPSGVIKTDVDYKIASLDNDAASQKGRLLPADGANWDKPSNYDAVDVVGVCDTLANNSGRWSCAQRK